MKEKRREKTDNFHFWTPLKGRSESSSSISSSIDSPLVLSAFCNRYIKDATCCVRVCPYGLREPLKKDRRPSALAKYSFDSRLPARWRTLSALFTCWHLQQKNDLMQRLMTRYCNKTRILCKKSLGFIYRPFLSKVTMGCGLPTLNLIGE